ncbi:MAG TPA: hypothetical protein VHJ38_04790 [Nitrososphaeraceae archaeon]|nr:hypothetical protein [Nitrososphaeraceae archaeon]
MALIRVNDMIGGLQAKMFIEKFNNYNENGSGVGEIILYNDFLKNH